MGDPLLLVATMGDAAFAYGAVAIVILMVTWHAWSGPRRPSE